ncbi:hypothetical protein H2201_002732 [Coniosporium apollinis]|uniref:YDG domain-containing protein n=2 Tax=Coniosporium TaxID=2810619 RepID=A0ABQ9NZR2_9PEZI|nr:hypothetical protein H2199_007035 [Cladosporium sp. JES 115]KAJ9667211.1 hypothetical protein H2201_002732 [Coniosporium apollinis]
MSYSRTLTITTDPINLTAESLKQQASRIRDILDPLIAREGADILHPDEVLSLHELFISLGSYPITVATLKYSRIHHAVMEVCGKATRWPRRLVDECDKIVYVWTQAFGPLKSLGPYLFEPGGRLWGALLKRWKTHPEGAVNDSRALRSGNLGFEPGRWWLNGLFAFHDGIIDVKSADGGICADKNGAYAIVLKGSDEVDGISPYTFTYRCKSDDPGRFRLTSAHSNSRNPVRVLRSHTLSSLWAPRTGIRYDGQYKVVGWTIRPPKPTEDVSSSVIWEVTLEREPGQALMEDVLRHPLADEVDDYMEYKRIRGLDRDELKSFVQSQFPRNSLAAKPSPRRTPSKLVPSGRAATFVMPEWDPKPALLSPTTEFPRVFTRRVTAREDSPIISAGSGPLTHSTSIIRSTLQESKKTTPDDEAPPYSKRSERVFNPHLPAEPVDGSFDGQVDSLSWSVDSSVLQESFARISKIVEEQRQAAEHKEPKPQTFHWDMRRHKALAHRSKIESYAKEAVAVRVPGDGVSLSDAPGTVEAYLELVRKRTQKKFGASPRGFGNHEQGQQGSPTSAGVLKRLRELL